MNKTISLGGAWQFCRCGETRTYPAVVPGTVCTDLLANGLMQDPYYRDNEADALAILHNDFAYSRSFAVAAEDLAADRVELVFHGLDTFAEVTLNGTVILQADDMHRTWRVDVKNVLCAGDNEITVRFASAAVRAKELHAKNHIYKTRDTVNGFEQVRKAHCMYGWDWGPQLPDMGIFRPVELHVWDEARITGCYVRQTHTEGRVTLRVETELETVRAAARTLQAQICAPDGTVVDTVRAETGKDQGSLELTVTEPQLWWPNGYGSQPLYTVRVALCDGDTELDSWERRIGLRTLTVCTDPDQWGRKFEVVVNGVSIFAMGANYIPEDSILSRVNRNTSRKLLEQCVKANYNMVRVWGGGYFQNDEFYDLCDEMGLLVWQDLLFACAVYRLTDRFVENIVQETRDNIRRLRHHACIALWCGNNELEWGWSGWDMGFGNNPYDRADYIKQFEWILPQTARECDPDRFYWLASPSSGGSFDDPNDQNRGDVHYARIRRELPGVTVELCASGGHRLCHSFLELACMASFSDAHECDEIPVIAANMHRILLPRQNQIWAVVRPGQSLPKLYYQLCSGLLGRLCLSGDAESWRADQWAVIRRGVAFYRQAAPVIDRGRSERLGPPVRSYRAPAGWQAVVRRGAGKTLVVLHTFAEAPEQIALPVGGTQPAVLARPGLGVAAAGGCLTVTGLRDFDAAAILLETEE